MSAKSDSPIAKKYVPSPNHDARESRVDILLLHYTGMQTANEALDRLKDREARVSCHYFVDEDGHVTQMVPEARRAWHGVI
jgi:N-acetylmuramoyl-L-alanine amidase